MNPIALAASIPVPLGLDRGYGEYMECDMFDGPRKSLMSFVRGGFVTLPGVDTKVSVRILRDTGAVNSYAVGSILPFSDETATGDKMLMRGMGMMVVPVPVNRLNIECELVHGEVLVGVRPALRVEEVDIILGNDLAGGHQHQ